VAKKKATPLMAQFNEIKAKHPGALLLFRVGDFYETFGEDAVTSSKILGITLTKRSNGSASEVALAGFPYHSLETYLPRLVNAGQRVAICEQLESPSAEKKIVERGVTELVTPGVHFRENILNKSQNNFLAAIAIDGKSMGIAFVDISTGEFVASENSKQEIQQLLESFSPKELVFSKSDRTEFENQFGSSYYTSQLPDWACHTSHATRLLKDQFNVESLKGFGLRDDSLATLAAGMIIQYLSQNGHRELKHIQNLQILHDSDCLWLDEFTLRNLEVLEANSVDGKSLLDIVDQAKTPMGQRLIRRWFSAPSRDIDVIQTRLDTVTLLKEDFIKCQKVREVFDQISDVERSVARIATKRIQAKELKQLAYSFQIADQSINQLDLGKRKEEWKPPLEEVRLINSHITENPAILFGKGKIIADGVDSELDNIRDLLENGKQRIEQMLELEKVNTGITSLRIGFNQVFGYHFEVRNTHKDRVPEHWIRKQTLVSAERYITPELKEFEERILKAQDELLVKERAIYDSLIDQLLDSVLLLQNAAKFIAMIDALTSFAHLSTENAFVKPTFEEDFRIELKDSRHPVIEAMLPPDKPYIANDIVLSDQEQQILMITGPNMSGKSALLRQVALSSLMAQAGCYVPASHAQLPILDKLFVRVGASDNISKGESTFMVEMTESASILNNLNGKCLVLLDEIGRGTSTYDGVSIAWAIASFIHEHPSRPLTLFATHYHELIEMNADYPRIQNMNVSVKESGKDILFLRKLVPGGSAHSFGIHVARMAGMPQYVIAKAEEVLQHFEKDRAQADVDLDNAGDSSNWQLSLIQMDDPLLKEVRDLVKNLDIDKLTPVEALVFLSELKVKIK
jgi:DNA mismatch repair protein MutS